jgi:hypothetical protein
LQMATLMSCKNICLQIWATWVLKCTSFDRWTTEKYRSRKETLFSEHSTKGMQLVVWKFNGNRRAENRFRRFLTKCPSRRNRFAFLFEACATLKNFVHRSRMDLS